MISNAKGNFNSFNGKRLPASGGPSLPTAKINTLALSLEKDSSRSVGESRPYGLESGFDFRVIDPVAINFPSALHL